MVFGSRVRVAGVAILAIVGFALTLVAAYVGVLAYLARHRGAPDLFVPFIEPPGEPAPTLGRVPLFRVARVGDRFEVVDDAGRVVVLRGVHAVSMRPPFRPVALGDEEPFRQWRSWGLNAVRLAVPWEALEPAPRALDLGHVRYVQWFLDAAHRNGIVVIVDNPLAGVSRCLGGAGAPVWAHRPGLVSEVSAASGCADPQETRLPDWPKHLRWWADFYDGSWTPDDITLQDHLIRVFVKLAEVVQNHPALLGYGLLGGPWCEREGFAAWLYPGKTPCEAAMADLLRRFALALRAVDADALILFEEPVRWDGAGPSGVEVAAPPVDKVVWSVPIRGVEVHGAREGCHMWPDLEVLSRKATERYRAAWVLAGVTATGSSAGAREDALHRLADIEDARVSAFFWLYPKKDDIARKADGGCGDGDLGVSDGCAGSEAAGTDRCSTWVLVRPTPFRIGGIPLSWGLDRSFTAPDGRVVENRDAFTLVFRQTTVFAETWVFIPRRAFYGEDPTTEAPEFTVDVSDGRWWWAEWDDQVLVWTPDPDADEHRLVVKPWGGRRAPGASCWDQVLD